MKAARSALLPAACRALAGLAAAGCSHPAPPPRPAGAPQGEAAAQARRDERLKLMEQYWEWSTAAPGGAAPRGGAEPLEYPAGNYDGIGFAPRAAADPSLAEPPRG